jgi:hypothetical protein
VEAALGAAADTTRAESDIGAAQSTDHYARDSITDERDLSGVLADLARAEIDKKRAVAALDELLRYAKG